MSSKASTIGYTVILCGLFIVEAIVLVLVLARRLKQTKRWQMVLMLIVSLCVIPIAILERILDVNPVLWQVHYFLLSTQVLLLGICQLGLFSSFQAFSDAYLSYHFKNFKLLFLFVYVLSAIVYLVVAPILRAIGPITIPGTIAWTLDVLTIIWLVLDLLQATLSLLTLTKHLDDVRIANKLSEEQMEILRNFKLLSMFVLGIDLLAVVCFIIAAGAILGESAQFGFYIIQTRCIWMAIQNHYLELVNETAAKNVAEVSADLKMANLRV